MHLILDIGELLEKKSFLKIPYMLPILGSSEAKWLNFSSKI